MRFRSSHRSKDKRTFNLSSETSSSDAGTLQDSSESAQHCALTSKSEIFTASSLRVTEPHLVLHPNPSRALLWHKHLILKQTCAGSPMLMLSPPPPVTPALPCSSSSSSSSNPWGRLPATESLDTAAPRRLAVSPGLWSGPLSLFAHALPPYVHHRIIFSFAFAFPFSQFVSPFSCSSPKP